MRRCAQMVAAGREEQGLDIRIKAAVSVRGTVAQDQQSTEDESHFRGVGQFEIGLIWF